MNKTKTLMLTSVLAPVLIVAGVALLILGTLPMENRLKDDTLTVKFILGKKVIDMSDAKYLPVPEDVSHNIIRTNGTSVGKKRSGHFMNTKTRNRYIFYLTGKGERTYFEIGDKKYLVDGLGDDSVNTGSES